MNIKEDRDQLHSALADLVTFLEKYPHPMKAMISTYMKDAIQAIDDCMIGQNDKDSETKETEILVEKNEVKQEARKIAEMDEMVIGALKNIGYGAREATTLAVSVTGDTVEERIKNALMSSTTLRPSHGDD